MPNLYVIAGCNGAGKTTASYTVLPEMLGCKEFVNADEIARGLSPFNAEGVAIEAGRLMLLRIKELMGEGVDFAFETTLATRSYVGFIKEAQQKGYITQVVYFWLNTPDLAVKRVAKRVANGGHNIEEDIIRRRYTKGIHNFFDLYISIADNWWLVDNSDTPFELIADGAKNEDERIYNLLTYQKIKDYER